MDGRLFLGVADHTHYALAVVGDLSGEIVATYLGGSVNHHFWGLEQARVNLKEIIARTVGWQQRQRLKGACFTYRADVVSKITDMPHLVLGLGEHLDVQIESFAASSTLGIDTDRERLLLMGGRSGLVVFGSEAGCLLEQRSPPSWNLKKMIRKKILSSCALEGGMELQKALYCGLCATRRNRLAVIGRELDHLVQQGNPLALELVHEVAHDLVKLVMRMMPHFSRRDPMIGLYGQILLGCPSIQRWVRHLIGLLLPQAQMIETPLAPARGAYLRALPDRRSPIKGELLKIR